MKRLIVSLILALSLLSTSAGENTSWTNYEAAPVNDGKLRLSAFWQRSSPAHDIVTENGATKLSKIDGWTYEFCVLIENISNEAIELPSSPKGGMPIVGIPISGRVIVPYIVMFGDAFGSINYVESATTFRPVKLKPGEATRLPIYYRIVKAGESLPTHWFYYAVEESVAKRYGWWSGSLACKGEEFIPSRFDPAR